MSKEVNRGPQAEKSLNDFSGLSSNDWYQAPPEDAEAKQLRQAAKLGFLMNADVRYPDITYPRLDELDFDTVERHYQRLLVDSQGEEDEDVSDRAYASSARKLAELYRHKEVQRRLGWSQDPELSRERAGVATMELFGEIDEDDFAHLISSLRSQAASVANRSVEARELLELTGAMKPNSEMPNYEITQSTIESLRADLYELFPGLRDILANVPADNAPLPDKIQFMQRVVTCVSSRPDATVEVVAGSKTAASTSVENRRITIGAERLATYSSQQLIKTSVHEAIGHLERGNRAALQTTETLRTTQSGNLAFEEGFATALEQIVTGETRIAGEQYYTAIGLQLGLDRGGRKRDFRETFEIMWRRLVVKAQANGEEMSRDAAQDQAYAQVMRTNRGGALDARDISYFEGSKRYAWVNGIAALEPSERKHALRVALSGRFDATNADQWRLFEDADTQKEAV